MVNISLNIILIVLLSLPGFFENKKTVAQSAETEILIIGTVHESTLDFDYDSLLTVFYKFKPDVILVESDSSYFDNNFSLKKDYEYMFPETYAITEYLKNHNVELRPYDINGRDEFLDDQNRLTNQSGFFSEMEILNDNGKYNEVSVEIYSSIKRMMGIANEMSYSTLSYINSNEGSLYIDTINYYTYEGIKNLIEETPELSGYKKYWEDEYGFWKKRNSAMVSNILSLSKLFEGKKILVMCGFAHKNILLTELLARSEEYNLDVKSLYDL